MLALWKIGHRAIDCRKRKPIRRLALKKKNRSAVKKTKPPNLAKVSHVKVDTGNLNSNYDSLPHFCLADAIPDLRLPTQEAKAKVAKQSARIALYSRDTAPKRSCLKSR